MKLSRSLRVPAYLFALLFFSPAQADVITEWNIKANDLAVAGKVSPAHSNRILALAHVAAFDAVNAISGRYPKSDRIDNRAANGASIDAAVAAAMRGVLGKALPQVQKEIDAAYVSALASIADGAGKTVGVALGENAATTILALRQSDGAAAPDTYVPFTAPGTYVATASVTVPHWGRRKPWVMSAGDQFRPPAPPALTSEIWARDYNEVKTLGGKSSTARTAVQTEIARFWETTQPIIYAPLARTVALQPGRDVTQNARLMAAVAVAVDDALIAIFDAKYTYNFWRPVTAIRNGDKDGNSATDADPAWQPLIDTPMHPEYPCAHCVMSGALAAVLQAEIGSGPALTFSGTSPSLPGVTRTWKSLAEFAQEVQDARVYDGVHYRNSSEVGTSVGRKVGELVAARWLR
jgi:PAP2 superfamily